MIALILAAGKGSRMAIDINKCLLEVNDKSLIEYNLDRAIDVCNKIIIVVGHQAQQVIDSIGYEYNGIQITYVLQTRLSGMVNAIECAKPYINEDFFLLLGDEYLINPNHKSMYNRFKKSNSFGICGIVYECNLKEISKTYTIVPEELEIRSLYEKPESDTILFNLKGTGHCMFKKEFFDYIDKTHINTKRNEKDFVSIVQSIIDNGNGVEYFFIADDYVNINTYEDLIIAQQGDYYG